MGQPTELTRETYYLILTAGHDGEIIDYKIRKNPCHRQQKEVHIKLDISLPKGLFDDPPLRAEIEADKNILEQDLNVKLTYGDQPVD